MTSSAPIWRHIGTSPPPESTRERLTTVIVGAGPVGLTMALDLGRRGHRVTVLNKLNYIAVGSKAICFAKRTLDIWQRLGAAEAMVRKGVRWETGKVFWGQREHPIYQFDLLPVKDQRMPAFINLQQYYAEELLVEALSRLPNVDIRWGHEVTALTAHTDCTELRVSCGEFSYAIDASWLIACDGHKSPIRQLMGLDFAGRMFEDNFLIADIRVAQEGAAERRFWFDPPFNPGQSALLHKQPDDVWRLDFQLGPNIDRAACVRPENVEPLVRGLIGKEVQFTPVWYSVYTFHCRRMERFVHDRVIFAGDSAHLVSPFGARGCNGGIADADNLCWKLDLVLKGDASPRLLDSYNSEATAIADENIRCSTRSTDFMTPKSTVSRAFRDAVLELANKFEFARPWVNSGRLSQAVSYPNSDLNTPDANGGEWGGIPPGSPAIDAPIGEGWLLDRLGDRFVLLTNGWRGAVPIGIDTVDVSNSASDTGLIRQRYDLQPQSAYLIRPDQYVAARWRNPTQDDVNAAVARATGAGLV
ncbi:FAD-dependent oxidoreductase [Steroidobacter sp.]|uniref:FAD-dependent oxidoreductase n=1 Tax=Steroidobacter sp. TaxID=1978227 RepID=UPI001A5F3E09|nr:FAD-dependent oxidoreductase [Steroidobacter sp.]MBL8271790.1 FAD-dependent oxidoreductase [Steroidobacter sp.]